MSNLYREEKIFKKWDILLYALLLLVIVGISLAVFLPKEVPLQKVEIYENDLLLYSYDFVTKVGKITEYGEEKVTVTEGEKTLVTVNTKGTNVIEIGSDYAVMADADCDGKDCVKFFSPLKSGGKSIVCLPHGVKVVAIGERDNEVKV